MLVCACLLVPAPAVRCRAPRCTSESDDSLTLEALRTRLRDTWRSLCEGAEQGATQGVGVGEWASRSLLTTRLDGLALDRVHLARSGIEGAGDGLFASRDLQAGSLVTLYPGDALRVWGGRDDDEDSWWGAPPASLLSRGVDYEMEAEGQLATCATHAGLEPRTSRLRARPQPTSHSAPEHPTGLCYSRVRHRRAAPG